jgi:stage II sporulation protein D
MLRARLTGSALAAAVAVASLAVAAAPAGAATTYTLVGHGWGHGVGLSQYGALGLAQQGASARAILAHYYPGTTVGQLGERVTMRVLLAERPAVRFGAAAPFAVRGEGAAPARRLAAGAYRIDPDTAPGALRIWSAAGRRYVASGLASPLRIAPGAAPLRLDERSASGFAGGHWHGSFRVVRADAGLLVVNDVPLAEYLRGVVPLEVPAAWPGAALRAQAIAARSYADATRRPTGEFDAFADTRSQMYGPIEQEQLAATEAVAATANLVVRYGGAVATTYFSSSSGGRTSSPQASFGAATGEPYLVPVADPYDAAGGLNPNHTWQPVAYGPRSLAAALGLGAPVGALDMRTDEPSRRALAVTFHRADGTDVELPAATVQARLGLRSTYFRLLETTLAGPAETGGERVALTGRVWPRPRAAVVLQYRRAGDGAWRDRRAVTVGADGGFTTGVRPRATTSYRVRRGSAISPVVRVAVRATVALDEAGGRFRGAVTPAGTGRAVSLEEAAGAGAWWARETTAVNDRGGFAFATPARPGRYRAAFAGDAQNAPAASRPVRVAAPTRLWRVE